MNKFLSFIMIAATFFTPQVMANNTEIQTTEDLEYNFSSTFSVPIKLAITKDFTTKEPINEGEKLQFTIIDDVFINQDKILSAGTLVNAKTIRFEPTAVISEQDMKDVIDRMDQALADTKKNFGV